MGLNLKNVGNRVDSGRVNAARTSRDISTADPSFDAGMEDDFEFDDFSSGGLDDSMLGSSGGFGSDPFGGNASGGFGNDPFGSSTGGGFGSDPFGGGATGGFGSDPFGGGGFGNNTFGAPGGFDANFGGGGGFGGFGAGNAPQPNNTKPIEDRAMEAAATAAKQSVTFFKDFIDSFKTCDANVRATWGRYSLITGIICVVVSVILLLFGKAGIGVEMLIGSLLSTATGVLVLCFSQDAVSNANTNTTAMPTNTMPPATPEYDQSFGWGNTGTQDAFGATDINSLGTGAEDDFDDDEDWGEDDDDEDWGTPSTIPEPTSPSLTWDFSSNDSSAMGTSESESVSDTPPSLDNLPSTGLIDRRSLFEHISACLKTITPDYSIITSVQEGTELFNSIDAIVQDCADIFKPTNVTDMPYLISLKETKFMIKLEVLRVKWLKNIDAYASEIIKKFAYDPDTGITDESVYGHGEAIGQSIYITVMKGETAMVSIKDVYKTNEADILNIDNKMPIVLGVGIDGKPIIKDFMKYFSILITGMPRSGKSWFLLAVLYQMMSYMSPNDLYFYIFDPKGKMSDFSGAITPHVRKFVSDDNAIIANLNYIVRVEGPRRKELIGADNCVNLEDYKKKNPNCDLPYIYIIIDEVVTLSERMNDDAKKEFQSLLSELVSQLPATGIRIMMVPHLVKDNIIKKNTTSLIPCRISVMGNKEHIESSCGVKNFPHMLTHQGDMCVQLAGETNAMFIHAAVMAKTNEENKQLFRFLAEMWAKVCPDSVAGSVYERVVLQNGDLLDSLDTVSTTNTSPALDSPFSQARAVQQKTTKLKSTPQNTSQVTQAYDWGNDIRNNGMSLNVEDDEIDLFSDEDF